MTVSRKQLYAHILLTVVCCGRISTNTVGLLHSPTTSLPTEVKNVIVKGKSQTEHIELTKQVNLLLECSWTGKQNKTQNITAYWRKDGQAVQDSNVTVELQNDQYSIKKMFSITNERDLGNYSCIFENEAETIFILAVPQIHEKRDKPIVSYLGDFVVMMCKIEEKQPKPSKWLWYKYNGTDKVQIDDSAAPHHYLIKNNMDEKDFKTKLMVKNLTDADSGLYLCSAVYSVGASESQLELKIISIMEPLKPFLGILVEVVVLVTAILIYERSRAKKDGEENGPTGDTKSTQPQEADTEDEGTSSVRQRKA